MTISPHTAPGTRVVAVQSDTGNHGPHPDLMVGSIYTVSSMEECEEGIIAVALEGIDHSRRTYDGWKFWRGKYEWYYDRECFELAALPRCLTSILDRAPTPKQRVRA